MRDLLSGPVVKTPCFHCGEVWVPSVVGELRSHMPGGAARKKKKKT